VGTPPAPPPYLLLWVTCFFSAEGWLEEVTSKNIRNKDEAEKQLCNWQCILPCDKKIKTSLLIAR